MGQSERVQAIEGRNTERQCRCVPLLRSPRVYARGHLSICLPTAARGNSTLMVQGPLIGRGSKSATCEIDPSGTELKTLAAIRWYKRRPKSVDQPSNIIPPCLRFGDVAPASLNLPEAKRRCDILHEDRQENFALKAGLRF